MIREELQSSKHVTANHFCMETSAASDVGSPQQQTQINTVLRCTSVNMSKKKKRYVSSLDEDRKVLPAE